jgi:hypothetical protein
MLLFMSTNLTISLSIVLRSEFYKLSIRAELPLNADSNVPHTL